MNDSSINRLHYALLQESRAMAGIPCTRMTGRRSKDKTIMGSGTQPNLKIGVHRAKHVGTGALP